MAVTIKSPQFGEALERALQKLKVNPRQFAGMMDPPAAYDHIRKIYNGEVFPGPEIHARICKFANLDVTKTWKMVLEDKGKLKGTLPKNLDINKELLAIEPMWVAISAEDKAEVLDLLRSKYRRVKKTRNVQVKVNVVTSKLPKTQTRSPHEHQLAGR
jgi:hypothetical protein